MATELAKAYVQIVPSADGISGKISQAISGEAASAGKSAGITLSNALGSALKVGTAAIGAAVSAMSAFGASSVSAGKEFDSAMAQVAATMGVTVDSISELRDFAQEMGSTTAFSATEAAEALNYMALAGYDAQTSMNMLPTVLDLAAAGGIDLAAASDMVTDASSALGLSLKETSIMVDQMAKASSKSNTSVAQLGEAFLTIGGTAKNLAGGTQELATMLGVLADNGIKGSEAGTHLRNIMLAMNPTTDAATIAWEKLGVSAYDSEGNLRDLGTIMVELNEAMSDMTQQEKTQMLTDMFNKTDLSSVNALLATTSERYEELAGAISEADGAASAMANTQLDNLAGDITLFQSALEGAKIAVSDKLTPALREFVQFGSEGLSRLTEAFKEGGLSGAMDEFGLLLGEGLTMVVDMIPELVNAGASLVKALVQGISDNISTIMVAATSILMTIVETIIDTLPSLIKIAVQIVAQLASGIAQALPKLIPAIVDAILLICNTLIENIDVVVDAAIQLASGLADGFIKALPALIEGVGVLIEKLVSALQGNVPKLLEAASGILTTILQGIVNSIPEIISIINQIATIIISNIDILIDASLQLLTGIVDGIINNIDIVIDATIQMMMAVIDSISTILPVLLEKLPEILTRIGQVLIENIPVLINYTVQVIQKLGEVLLPATLEMINMILSNLDVIITTVIDLVLNIAGALLDNIDIIIDAAITLTLGLVEGIITAMPQIIEAVVSLVTKLVEKIPELVVKIVDALVRNVPKIISALGDIFVSIGTAIDEHTGGLFTNILNALKAFLEKPAYYIGGAIGSLLRDFALWGAETNEKLKTFFSETIPAIWKSFWEWLKKLPDQIFNIFNTLPDKMANIGKNIVEGLKNGIKNTWSSAFDTVTDFAKGFLDGVTGVFGIHSPSKEFEWIGEMCVAGLEEGFEEMPDVVSDTQKVLDDTFSVASSMSVTHKNATSNGSTADIAGAVYEALNNLTIKAEMNPNMSKFFESMRAEAKTYHNRTGREAFA